MSQGAMASAPRLKVGNKIVLIGKNIHHFGIRLMEFKSEHVTIAKQTFKLTELWKVFRDYAYELFPAAQAEALSKSKELPKSEHSIQGHDFKVGDEENE